MDALYRKPFFHHHPNLHQGTIGTHATTGATPLNSTSSQAFHRCALKPSHSADCRSASLSSLHSFDLPANAANENKKRLRKTAAKQALTHFLAKSKPCCCFCIPQRHTANLNSQRPGQVRASGIVLAHQCHTNFCSCKINQARSEME